MIQERPGIGGIFLCGFGKKQTVYEHFHRYVRKCREGKGLLTRWRENIERFLQILRCGWNVVQRMVNIHIGWNNGYGAFAISEAEHLSFVPGTVQRNRGDGCIAACRKRECCQEDRSNSTSKSRDGYYIAVNFEKFNPDNPNFNPRNGAPSFLSIFLFFSSCGFAEIRLRQRQQALPPLQ